MQTRIHDLASAPQAATKILQGAQDDFGMIPNLLGVLAESPPTLEAYTTLGGLFGESALTDIERNVVWLTISFENDCHYCVPAHTAIAMRDDVPEETIEKLRAGESLNDSKLEALRNFTALMVRNRGRASEAELETFLEAGFEQRHVFEVILGIAHKTISNYVNHVAETPVDEPFRKFDWNKAEAA